MDTSVKEKVHDLCRYASSRDDGDSFRADLNTAINLVADVEQRAEQLAQALRDIMAANAFPDLRTWDDAELIAAWKPVQRAQRLLDGLPPPRSSALLQRAEAALGSAALTMETAQARHIELLSQPRINNSLATASGQTAAEARQGYRDALDQLRELRAAIQQAEEGKPNE